MKDKKIIVLIVLILISIIALIGSSYALLTKSFKSEKLSMQVGTLKVDFTEGNAITMNNAMPMTDENGMNTTPYTFTITNSGDVDAYYTVSNEEELANTLDTNYLKMRLTGSDGYDSGIKRLKDLGTSTYRIVDETSLATGKSVTYKLYLWISSDADNSIQDKVYKSKIVVSSTSNRVYSTVAETLLKGVGDNGAIDTSDSEQTFITGDNPNNYIWYSGKLWRAVSIDSSDNSVKLVTQWNISSIVYNNNDNNYFKDSYMEDWLNDTSVDGFLGNLRESEKFIKMNSVWNTTISTESIKTEKTTMVTDAVGLLNLYEYTMSCNNKTSDKGYLANGLWWWTLTPSNNTGNFYYIGNNGFIGSSTGIYPQAGIRPSINLNSNIKIVLGDGSNDNPYRLEGDADSLLNGNLLSTRYSGEYIRFGTGENNLYRIVSHENNSETKIVSSTNLKDTKLIFDNDTNYYSNQTKIGYFLNNDYLKNDNYLTKEETDMISDSSVWYLGIAPDAKSYKLSKYNNDNMTFTENTVNSKIGLLRYGELMSGVFSNQDESYFLLTRYNSNIRAINSNGYVFDSLLSSNLSVKPTFNLKSNVVITGGDGTKNNPFTVKLG